MNLRNATDVLHITEELTRRWNILFNTPRIFSYKLNIRKEKYTNGKYKFYCQLNPERTQFRRPAQPMLSLNPSFSDDKFNFKKIHPDEKILEIIFDNNLITLIINNSPLTNYHSLICPNLMSSLPQILTVDSINFAINFIGYMKDKNFRIGYNSPGAFASVNHLHLHLLYITADLYVNNVELKCIKENIFRGVSCIQFICFVINSKGCNYRTEATKIFSLIEKLCQQHIPHNLFFTQSKDSDEVKVFVFVREKPFVNKDLNCLNVAFCEFSGYIPVGDENLYNSITEDWIVEKISSEIGTIFEKILLIIEDLSL